MRDTFADTTRARADLGFAPTVTLEAGPGGRIRWLAGTARLEPMRWHRTDSIVVAEFRRATRAGGRRAGRGARSRPAAASSARADRRARRTPTSSCSSAAPRRSTSKKLADGARVLPRSSSTAIRRARTAPTPSSASATPTSARARRVATSSALNEFREFLAVLSRRTSAPTTRSTSWRWRTSSRCVAPSATRPRRATRSASSTRFVERYPNSALIEPKVESPAARGADRLSAVRVQRRAVTTTGSRWYPRRRRAASRSCSSDDPEFTSRDAVYFYLGESLREGRAGRRKRCRYYERLVKEFEQSEHLDRSAEAHGRADQGSTPVTEIGRRRPRRGRLRVARRMIAVEAAVVVHRRDDGRQRPRSTARSGRARRTRCRWSVAENQQQDRGDLRHHLDLAERRGRRWRRRARARCCAARSPRTRGRG